MCVGLTYSGEYVCDVTLECASTPGKLKSLLGHGGNRTGDLWDTIVQHALPIELRGQVGSVPTVTRTDLTT